MEVDPGGWRGYDPWTLDRKGQLACTDCGGSLVVLRDIARHVLVCDRCHGRWIPGRVLELDEKRIIRMRAKYHAIGEPMQPWQPTLGLHEYTEVIRRTAQSVGVRPEVLDELLSSSIVNGAQDF